MGRFVTRYKKKCNALQKNVTRYILSETFCNALQKNVTRYKKNVTRYKKNVTRYQKKNVTRYKKNVRCFVMRYIFIFIL